MDKLSNNINSKEIFDFCEGYKDFISQNKTERECVISIREMAKKEGYQDLKEIIKSGSMLKAGDKIYATNLDKCIFLFKIGNRPISDGMRILGAHIDSPRLDLKPNPLYEESASKIALLDTHYYGGIKHYQWTALPLAIHGIVCKKDGSTIHLNIGEKEQDPVFCITDLLPHLDRNRSKAAEDKIVGENLNVIIGGIPADSKNDEYDAKILHLLKDYSIKKSSLVKENILNILKDYNIDPEDFISAEIEIVPAGRARDMGLDRSFVLGYGQDDRICAYTSLKAIFDAKTDDYTIAGMFVDKEEVGSQGASGMQSLFFEDMIAEIAALIGETSPLALRRALRNSYMLSSDVTAGFDPNYAAAFDVNNDAYLGRGISFNKYTGSRGKSGANDASPEYIAKLRDLLDKEGIKYQLTEMGKIDQGGGGTIAYITANYGMNVIDCGCPLLNMHAPWEISSKADIYEAYKCYKAFLTLKSE